MSRVLDRQILSTRKVEQVRRVESGFIARIEERVAIRSVAGIHAWLEELLETSNKFLIASAQSDEVLHIVLSVEGVGPGKVLVVWVAPVAAAALSWVIGVFERAVGGSGNYKACDDVRYDYSSRLWDALPVKLSDDCFGFQWFRQFRDRFMYFS